MSFTRTKSGLSNYAYFFAAEIMVFVEGGDFNKASSADEQAGAKRAETEDEIFHRILLSKYSGHRKFKIKSVGPKTNLDKYAEKIAAGNLKNCLVIYDSDFEGITTSWVKQPWILRTYGYSWENDLWTLQLCEKVVDLFTGGRAWDIAIFRHKFKRAACRLERLSRIEVFCRVYGLNLILPKGKSVGVKLDASSPLMINRTEVSRLIGGVKDRLRSTRDIVLNSYLGERLKAYSYPHLVRGHLWEAVCITLIVATLREISCCPSMPTENVRNVALSLFSHDPATYMELDAIEHYKEQQRQVGL